MKTIQKTQAASKISNNDVLTEQTICFVYPNGDVVICAKHQKSFQAGANLHSRH